MSLIEDDVDLGITRNPWDKGLKVHPRVFRVNDYEWWAGLDLESVKEACERLYGEDDTFDDDVHELSNAEMLSLRFYDDMDNPTTSESRSFAEQLQIMINEGSEFPSLFASAEY